MSGRSPSQGEARPNAISGSARSRIRVRQKPSQAMPHANTPRLHSGIAGTAMTAWGKAATVRPIHRIAWMPQPMGCSTSHSRCSGISTRASSPAGMTTMAVIGTATMLASTK